MFIAVFFTNHIDFNQINKASEADKKSYTQTFYKQIFCRDISYREKILHRENFTKKIFYHFISEPLDKGNFEDENGASSSEKSDFSIQWQAVKVMSYQQDTVNEHNQDYCEHDGKFKVMDDEQNRHCSKHDWNINDSIKIVVKQFPCEDFPKQKDGSCSSSS